jgi:hypothetical protein
LPEESRYRKWIAGVSIIIFGLDAGACLFAKIEIGQPLKREKALWFLYTAASLSRY